MTDKTQNQIEKPWAVYGWFLGPWGIGKVVYEEENSLSIKYCEGQNIEVPFKRPKELAQDNTPMLSVIKHAVGFLEKNRNYKPDYIVLLQPTSPLRKSKHIDEAIGILIKSSADSIVSVVEVPHNFNPYSVMEFDGVYLKRFLQFNEKKNSRQEKPKFYARNGAAIIAFTRDCLSRNNSLYGEKILPYFMKKNESMDIDDEFDWQIADSIMKKVVE